MRKFTTELALLLALILFAGCTSAAAPTAAQRQPAAPAAAFPATLTPPPSLTALPTQTASPRPPTLTQTPTATPTPELPVLYGTAVPRSSAVLNAQNISKLTELARLWTNPDAFSKTSADGKHLVSGSAEGFLIFDVQSGALLKRIDANPYFPNFLNSSGHGDDPALSYTFQQLAINADGSRFAWVDADGAIHVTSSAGEELLNLPLDGVFPYETRIDLSPDGKLLAYSSTPQLWYYGQYFSSTEHVSLHLFDVDTKAPLELDKQYAASRPQFSNDGKYLIAQSANYISLLIFSVSERKQTGSIVTKMQKMIPAWAADPKTTNLIAGDGQNFEVWDYAAQKMTNSFQLEKPVTSAHVHFSREGSYVIIFDRIAPMRKGSTNVFAVDYRHSTVTDHLETSQFIIRDPYRVDANQSLKISRLAVDFKGWYGQGMYSRALPAKISAFDFRTGGGAPSIKLSNQAQGYSCDVGLVSPTKCIFPEDWSYRFLYQANSLYTMQARSKEKEVWVFEGSGTSGQFIGEMPFIGGFSHPIPAVSREYQKLLVDVGSGDVDNMAVWDISAGKIVAKTSGAARGSASSAALSGDGRYAALLTDQPSFDQLMLYDLKDMALVMNQVLKIPASFSRPKAAFSADGKVLAVTAAEYASLPQNAGYTYKIALNMLHLDAPDQQFVTTIAVDKTNPAFDFRNTGAATPIADLALNADGRLLALGLSDGQILLIDTFSGQMIRQFQAHNDPVLALTFADDGASLASLGRAGIIKVWGLP